MRTVNVGTHLIPFNKKNSRETTHNVILNKSSSQCSGLWEEKGVALSMKIEIKFIIPKIYKC